ncbi:hypothetical protein, variant 9 [Cryptococcus amylolentus CBS 6039]|uniref:Uncharacterized protein n=1 Tax=Cryptococcus amylolentus CBS 6039 TaxID=1295533 RepID=A0A1E3HXM2_9TREE|nr:hypothetical protein, variant 8 [Cryptococcus amylolentus CBS 6039]XP_018995093.1 hypothetical protein, variant 9 [Cryptococcus amylolentus CBS 6039]ODN80526.1 hypothetical protein, variant 8 [Cryptococcus amylolentus CBS 6039]ODN80527.1 hypothetical protein, variant 9 [Cryptococcus amylolentus CBS 6039]
MSRVLRACPSGLANHHAGSVRFPNKEPLKSCLTLFLFYLLTSPAATMNRKKYPSKAKPTHPSTTTRKGKGKAATAPPPEGRGSRGENAVAGPSGSPVTEEIDDGEIEVRDEQWDVYFHAFLLHYTRHSECYWYRDSWWFPETGRNEKTLHMFVAARWAPIDNLKYYNLHLPNGKIMENVML